MKNIGVQESVLLLAFSFCVGFSGRAEALELALPMSIHEILSSDQIEKVRAGNTLKAVQQGVAHESMKKQAVNNVPAMQKMMGMRLSRIMNSKLSAQPEEKATLQSTPLDVESTVQMAFGSDDTHKDE